MHAGITFRETQSSGNIFMLSAKPVRVLFVCMGNICRSPTAHGVFQALVKKEGLGSAIEVDSAGTHSYHIGSRPDSRSQATAKQRGIDLSKLRGRRLIVDDFTEFDYLLGMDQSNIKYMRAIKPEGATSRLQLLLEYSKQFSAVEVPDPYFGNDGFDLVFDMIDDAARGLLQHIRREHRL
jgi:protein-tyrosine phosphatase